MVDVARLPLTMYQDLGIAKAPIDDQEKGSLLFSRYSFLQFFKPVCDDVDPWSRFNTALV